MRVPARAQRPQAENVTPKLIAATAELGEAQIRRDLHPAGYENEPIDPAALPDALQTYRSRATGSRCRKHMYLAMPGPIKNSPDPREEGRLGMIPVGDVLPVGTTA